MKKYAAWITIAYLLISTLNVHQVVATPTAIDNDAEILVLHSYSHDYEWTKTEQIGIENIFKPLINQYQMRIEYMDSGHNPQLLHGQLLQELYKQKFSNSHFRVIIVSDNAAFDFLRQYRDELFPGVPVVFCGINGYDESMIAGLDGFTGIAEDNDFMGLFNIAFKLHPNLQQIVIYGVPSDPSHQANIAIIRKLLLRYQPHYKITIREFPHIDACVEDAKNLPPNSAILMVGSMSTANGEGVNLQLANEIMAASVPLPIYTAWDFGVGHGAVGGRVTSGVNQGELAAEIALRILKGEPAYDIPVSRHVGNIYMFDYDQMTRFHLQTKDLPPETIIANSPDRTYKVNREIIWVGTLFLGCLFVAVCILIINVRKRKIAEEALLASQEKFSKAFKYCADIVGIATLSDGRYVEVSQAFFETFGYTSEEVIGKISTSANQEDPNHDTFPLWLSIDERDKLFHNLNTYRVFKNLETNWCTKTGEIRVGLYSAEIVEIGGEPCIIYAWHDITDRKNAEVILQSAHDNLEDKIERRTHELSSLNQELTAMNEELQTTNWELENEIASRRQMEQKLSDTNQRLTHAIEELQTMQIYLVESAKMASLGNLVAGIAHEVNTPLGVGLTAASHLQELTIGFSNLCMHGTPRRHNVLNFLDELQESSIIILKNLERAGKLIQSFKQVAVDQSSEMSRVFNVKNYLAEILLSIQPQLKKTYHRITLECDDTLTMNGYPGALSQIITNLIMNSIIHAYSPRDYGKITIAVKIEAKNLILLYTDDGKGMDYTVLSKIFDPFYTTKRGHGGTGLGLHVVYNLVTQQFKGTINCESQPEQGATFRICLPLPKEDLPSGFIE